MVVRNTATGRVTPCELLCFKFLGVGCLQVEVYLVTL
jgi:hypothetical protein